MITSEAIKLIPSNLSYFRGIHTSIPLFQGRKNQWVHRKKYIDRGNEFPVTFTLPKHLKRDKPFGEPLLSQDMQDLREKFPDFLPHANPEHRHKVASSLERADMLSRRKLIDVPEFYVGSVLAVTVSDPFAAGKISRFLGICISREGTGLRSAFTLRNVIDREGIEIRYDIYNPTIRSIEVLKLEKRLDQNIEYLRDADPVHSTFPLDMKPELRKENEPVPVNPIKVKLLSKWWTSKWYSRWLQDRLHGIEDMMVRKVLYERSCKKYEPAVKYDLMKEYRKHVPEELQVEIWQEIKAHDDSLKEDRKKTRRAKMIRR